MSPRIPLLVIVTITLGCGSESSLSGDPDSSSDTSEDDTQEDLTDTPVEEPIDCDRDLDGHPGPHCGGDDCDDSDPTIHPGAPDYCDDDIDQNCDGVDSAAGLLEEDLIVASGTEYSRHMWPALLWTGSEYSLALRSGLDADLQVFDISATENTLTDSHTLSHDELAFDVTWSSGAFGTVWATDDEDATSLYFQSYDGAGAPLTEPHLMVTAQIPAFENLASGPHISPHSEGFDIVWVEYDVIDGQQWVWLASLDRFGVPRHENVMVATLPIIFPWEDSIVLPQSLWNGIQTAVFWIMTNHSTFMGEIYLQRVSPAGEPFGDMILLSETANRYLLPEIMWTGSEYSIIWAYNDLESNIYIDMMRITPTGEPVHLANLLTLETWTDVDAAWTGDGFALIWEETPYGRGFVHVDNFTPDGILTGPRYSFLIVNPTYDQMQITPGTTSIGFAWPDTHDLDSDSWTNLRFNRIGLCPIP